MKQGDNRVKSVTMTDIAAALGVSVVTVSNALAGKKGVSPKLRAAVQMKARELGYTEGIEQKSDSISARTGDIGIISPQRYLNSGNDYHWSLYQELITQLKKDDRYAILDIVNKEDESALKLPRVIEENLVSGIIMLGRPEFKFLTEITRRKLPIVFLDFSMRDFDFACVVGDDYNDMYRLTSFVISHGHSNIAYVSESLENPQRDKYFGYCCAAAESEIKIARAQLLDDVLNNFEMEGQTAIICENRDLAVKTIEAFNEAGITVPDMISVACFSDTKSSDEKEITCICRDSVQMTRAAVDILKCKMTEEVKNIGRISVGGKLVVGTTVRSLII